jgi:hypothetical protein
MFNPMNQEVEEMLGVPQGFLTHRAKTNQILVKKLNFL